MRFINILIVTGSVFSCFFFLLLFFLVVHEMLANAAYVPASVHLHTERLSHAHRIQTHTHGICVIRKIQPFKRVKERTHERMGQLESERMRSNVIWDIVLIRELSREMTLNGAHKCTVCACVRDVMRKHVHFWFHLVFARKLKAFGWCNESFATCDVLVKDKIQHTPQLFCVSLNTNNTRGHTCFGLCMCVCVCSFSKCMQFNNVSMRMKKTQKRIQKEKCSTQHNGTSQKDTVAFGKIIRLIYNNLQSIFLASRWFAFRYCFVSHEAVLTKPKFMNQ